MPFCIGVQLGGSLDKGNGFPRVDDRLVDARYNIQRLLRKQMGLKRYLYNMLVFLCAPVTLASRYP